MANGWNRNTWQYPTAPVSTPGAGAAYGGVGAGGGSSIGTGMAAALGTTTEGAPQPGTSSTGVPNFANMTDQELQDYIVQNDPGFVVYLNIPEIHNVIFDPANRGFLGNSNWINDKIQQTDWWKQHSATQREWFALSESDPATADIKIQDKIKELGSIATDAGLILNADQLRWEATAALANGWSDQMARQNLLTVASMASGQKANDQTGGSIGKNMGDIQALAAQYLVRLSDTTVRQWAQGIWDGSMSMDTIKGNLSAQANQAWGTKNPDFTNAISRGITPRQFIDPQLQAVAKTLEMSPDQMDPLDPKWSSILNYQDKSGAIRMMTVPEAELFARQQREYRYTDQANQGMDQRLNGLLQTMGVVKF